MEDYIVSERQREIWNVEIMILCEFMRVCKANDLKFFVAHGTLLGAVRHKGFIPWDDDIDINMPREDYERLKEIAPKAFQEPFFFQCFETDPNSFWGCGKIRYSKATGMDLQDISRKTETNNGLYIDIFPMDNVIDDLTLRKGQSKKVEIYRKLLSAKIYGKFYDSYLYIEHEEWEKYKFISRFFDAQWLYRKFEYWVQKYNNIETERSGIIAFKTDYECCYWYKEDYEQLIELDFEDIKVPGPANYDRCLSIKWGDYMQLPPKNQRGKKHDDVIMDAGVPYMEYDVSRFLWSIKDLKGKRVILFGTGGVASYFYNKYAKVIGISLALDNNVDLNGKDWNGIKVILPDDYKQEENDMVIIAARDFRTIGSQLEKSDITNYLIFIQGRIY